MDFISCVGLVLGLAVLLLPILALAIASEAKRRALAVEEELRRVRRDLAQVAEEAARMRRALEAQGDRAAAVVERRDPGATVPAPPAEFATAAAAAPPAADPSGAPAEAPTPVRTRDLLDGDPAPPRRSPPPPLIERGRPLPGETVVPRSGDPVDSPSLEMFLGRRVFLVVGAVVLLLGVAWGFKVAMDRGWIGPAARVATGVALGIAALAGGDVLRRKGLATYGAGLMGFGLGALYLSVWFASARYELLSRGTGLGVMAALTAGGAVLALLRDAPLLAHLGFLGGFLAPALLSTGEDRLGSLVLWLLALDAGVTLVAWRRRWPGLEGVAALAGPVYFTAWSGAHFSAGQWDRAGVMLALLCAGSLTASLLPAVARREAPHALALLAAIASGFTATVLALSILLPDHRTAAGAGILGLALAYAGFARAVHVRAGAAAAAESLLAMALAALATAIPVLLGRHAVHAAWGAVGVAVLHVGVRHGLRAAAYGGRGMIVLALLHLAWTLLDAPREGFTPFLRPEFAGAAVAVASPLAAGWLLRRADGAGGTGMLLLGTLAAGPVLLHEVWTSRGPYPVPGVAAVRTAWCAAVTTVWATASAWAWRRAEEGPRIAATLAFLLPLAMAAWLMTEGYTGPFTPVLNPAFLGGACVVAGGVAAAFLAPGGATAVVRAGMLALLLAVISTEIHAYGAFPPEPGITREAARFRAQVWISVAWAIYASALLALGFLGDRRGLRWGGMVVFGLALAKVMLVDMATLDALYRIASFLVLGALLLGFSYLYWSRRDTHGQARRTGDADDSPRPAADGDAPDRSSDSA